MHRTPLIRGNVEVVDVRPVQDWPGRLVVHFDDIESGSRHVIEPITCSAATAPTACPTGHGVRMIDLGFEQRWLVVDVETDADLRQWDGVHQVYDRRRAATFMRIGQRR